MSYFPYGKTEMDYLQAQDPALGQVIRQLGIVKKPVIAEPYIALVNIIIGQQIFGKAQETLWQRLKETCSPIAPTHMVTMEKEALQAVGISKQKATAILTISQAVVEDTINFERLKMLSDQEVMKALTEFHGIGPWTAEMFLWQGLLRPDVLSYNDFGIRKGLKLLHQLDKLNRKTFHEYQEKYRPYGTVAAFYLWEIAATDGKILEKQAK